MNPKSQHSGPRNKQEMNYTPREIVGELDRYIVGQKKAKRAVAIALRNRWRRKRVPAELRDEIAPKNIILIGSTGVGKTEIARRLAKLAQAPFIKVEASKFTEVGYVGRDVDSMVRDLVDASIHLVREEEQERVTAKAKNIAEEHLLDLLLPRRSKDPDDSSSTLAPNYENNTVISADDNATHTLSANITEQNSPTKSPDSSRESLRQMLRKGTLDHRHVEVDAPESRSPTMQVFSGAGLEEMGLNIGEMMSQMTGKPNTKKRRVNIPEALDILQKAASDSLIDDDHVAKEAVYRAENSGIIFLDEIDKIAKQGGGHGPEVSREGVQRDILPIVEGSMVTTKYGVVRTDHVLFIAAGAFHVSKVSDLIPELQGRFPIRVQLDSLGEKELLQILVEPQNSLPVQYKALLKTEKVALEFPQDGLRAIAKIAAEANDKHENIGARRLHTVVEKLLEEISFHAPERAGENLIIDQQFVESALHDTISDADLSRYIL